jgi:ribosomal protein S18 acetylase RimI-like enzyme
MSHADTVDADRGSTFAEIAMAVADFAALPVDGAHAGRRDAAGLVVRPARPADVPVLLHMKLQLAILEESEFALRATQEDWLRDGFGPNARFESCIAEWQAAVAASSAAGMVTFSERYYTGWAGSSLYIQDLYVDPAHRRRGVARALLAQVAAVALERACPFVELTVREDNPAGTLYRRSGFVEVRNCAAYVLGGPALAGLAAASTDAASAAGT